MFPFSSSLQRPQWWPSARCSTSEIDAAQLQRSVGVIVLKRLNRDKLHLMKTPSSPHREAEPPECSRSRTRSRTLPLTLPVRVLEPASNIAPQNSPRRSSATSNSMVTRKKSFTISTHNTPPIRDQECRKATRSLGTSYLTKMKAIATFSLPCVAHGIKKKQFQDYLIRF